VFIAHPKAMPDAELAALKADVEGILRESKADATVTLGRDDFDVHFARCGSWNGWALDVSSGIHPVTREPRYTHFVVPGTRVGKATASILLDALARGKKVIVYEEGKFKGPFHSVVRVIGGTPQNGWELR
jgi:hypothetical protein